MAEAMVNGVRLSYQIDGTGDPVVLICGTGQPAISWHLGLVPQLVKSGYQVLTFDNRGVPPSAVPPPPYAVSDLVADAVALIEHLGLDPCRVAGHSLGGFITQELALARPDLVRGAVMMGTRGRSVAINRAWEQGILELLGSGITLPPSFEAMVLAYQVIGRRRLFDDEFVETFIELTQSSRLWEGPGAEGQLHADRGYDNRLEDLRAITVPCLVVAFEDDRLTPAFLGREVADVISGCQYFEVPQCGHLGPMEDLESVMPVLVNFFEGI